MISREEAPHYVWGGVCDGWHLVKTPALSVIQERMPPGSSEVAHFHGSARQFFFVLEGELRIELEHGTEILGREQGLEIPPLAIHRAHNVSQGECRFLVVSHPPSAGDRVDRPPKTASSP
jgi:mannose-6-phosphate isomerase-like protein (cupin superfamily)